MTLKILKSNKKPVEAGSKVEKISPKPLVVKVYQVPKNNETKVDKLICKIEF